MLPLLATAAAAPAQPPETTETLLIATLEANAAGKCPDALMAAALQAQCEQNLPKFVELLRRLGPIRSASYQGTETLQGGPADVYKVAFANGDMTFLINTLEDGRAMTLFAPDPPLWNDQAQQGAKSTPP